MRYGMLFDLGPHLVDQVLALFGVPEGDYGERSKGPRCRRRLRMRSI